METTEVTIATLAGEAYSWFETAHRVTGDTDTGPREDGEAYTRTKDDAPEWVSDLVREAHGDFHPDDWRYDCIRAACSAIKDNDGDEDSHEFADNYADVYNAARTAWLASNLNRAFYCDDAVEEGLVGPDTDIFARIGVGQYMEAAEVYGLVYRALEERLDAIEDESGEDE